MLIESQRSSVKILTMTNERMLKENEELRSKLEGMKQENE